MRNHLLIPFFLFFSILSIAAKPIFKSSKYFISSLYDSGSGVVSQGSGNYQLIYDSSKDETTAAETDYWIIKNISDNLYTFRNASTKQYIRYNAANADRNALVMTDALQADNSTSFTLELKQNNGLSYYIIRSAANTAKIWNRRVTLAEGVYPVGVYAGAGGANELFVFYDVSGNAVADDEEDNVSIVLPQANKTLGAFNAYFSSLTFNEKTPVVDTQKKEFYLTIPDSTTHLAQQLPVKYTSKNNAAYQLYINGAAVPNNTTYNFGIVSATKKYTLEVKSGASSIASGTLYFSCLPLVQIYSDDVIGSVYNLCRIAVTEPKRTDSAKVLLSNIKVRGGISTGFPKKQYSINLRDSLGVLSGDYPFLGLRNDNNWILDAMYIDPGRMRNRVNTDLWNDFSTKPYWYPKEPKMRNGTRGQFVEVFMNDAYHGLYCMTEKVDRKQLNLKKLKYSPDSTVITVRGSLFKAENWSIATLLGYGPFNNYGGIPNFSNSSETWSAFVCKHPELDEGEPIDWTNLHKGVTVASYLTNDADFKARVSDVFDLPVFLDYYLLIELNLATDNHGKNMFLSIYDQTVSAKLSLTPWDMDGTWGIRWNGNKDITGAEQDFDTFVINNEHAQLNLYLRLKSLDYNGWFSSQLKNRYRELRGNYFSYDNLMGRFTRYSDLFTKSGAAAREQNRWGMRQPISDEMIFLSDWVKKRLRYLDLHYLGEEYTGTNSLYAASALKCMPNPVTDWMTVSGVKKGDLVSVYTLQGVLLKSVKADNDEVRINLSDYQSGVYLIKSGGSTSKVIKR